MCYAFLQSLILNRSTEQLMSKFEDFINDGGRVLLSPKYVLIVYSCVTFGCKLVTDAKTYPEVQIVAGIEAMLCQLVS